MLPEILPGLLPGLVPGTLPEILLGPLPETLVGMLPEILPGLLLGLLPGTLSTNGSGDDYWNISMVSGHEVNRSRDRETHDFFRSDGASHPRGRKNNDSVACH